jgi:hypothetical protein
MRIKGNFTMTTQIRGASQISDAEFLTAYNNKAFTTNSQVMDSLSTDWTAVGVKLRSTRVQLHTIVNRTGGKSGGFVERVDLALEAKIWLKNGSVQTNPKSGPYISLAERVASGTISIDPETLEITTVVGTTAPTPTSTPVSTPTQQTAPIAEATQTNTTSAPIADQPVSSGTTAGTATAIPVQQAQVAFAFTANIFGQSYEMSGASKEDAMHALFGKLQELNFSKVAITDTRSGQAVGINDIVNGGSYKLAKQLTAA